ncbi:arf-GAP with SH3 domain, ANK repeat and PH domain-containing protein 2 isoform X6 [Castor canadensis]|uniref:Arf-GAP with SH3 domain, ANK repeat and PH domain-containing protein 2 isoform X6 n=1 Tax=Castor canadensis TaxID=51338 RepID=A0AC58KK92_CASCN
MPDQISVSEFVAETHEDYKAPTASSFTTRTAQCRNTVAAIEEALDVDRMVLYKMKKSVKAINISGLDSEYEQHHLLPFGQFAEGGPERSKRGPEKAL